MEIIKNSDVKKVKLSSGVWGQHQELIDMLKGIDEGEGVKLGSSEWDGKTAPNQNFLRKYFFSDKKKFIVRKLEFHKGWFIVRVPFDADIRYGGYYKYLKDKFK